MTACHTLTQHFGPTDLTIALAGNPNVGKSSLFNRLTGANVETAHYPGKTVALNYGTTRYNNQRIGVIDLPGTYALGALSEDQWVARQGVLDNQPDAIIAMIDATNLERNLYLVLQLLDLGLPLVAAVNLMDEAERVGIAIDTASLSRALGVPVVPTIATRGKGVEQLVATVAQLSHEANATPPQYDLEIETARDTLTRAISNANLATPNDLSPRALAMLLLEDDPAMIQTVLQTPAGAHLVAQTREIAAQVEARVGEPLSLHIPRARYTLAHAIAQDAQIQKSRGDPLSVKMWHWSVQPITGIPALIAVLVALFGYLFWVGGTLSEAFSGFWESAVSPLIQAAVTVLLGKGIPANIALWGLDAGVAAALGIGIPYVLTFYIALAILEDSGYMNSLAFLLDALMKRLGLHGRAAIILLAGAGCNVPAIMGTRVLTTRRERIIASTLVVLTPCSARIAVIAGGAAMLAGWQAGAGILLLAFALIIAVGIGMNRLLPGHSDDLVMEMFPFRVPTWRVVLRKTWVRFKEFLFEALPVVLIGSFVMGALYETNWVWAFSAPLAPVVEGWLGLPPVAGLALMFAVLRKELALQFLVTLAIVQYGTGAENFMSFMTPHQLFVYALVNTIYIPCVATIAVLNKELGTRAAFAITAFTVVLALAAGGIARYVLALV